MICIFHLLSDDPDGPARCWAVTGLLLRMAQSVSAFIRVTHTLTLCNRLDYVRDIPVYSFERELTTALDRKTSLFEQNPKEHRRRARLWWEIAFFDRIQSLFYGRPTGINSACVLYTKLQFKGLTRFLETDNVTAPCQKKIPRNQTVGPQLP
jgi:hypothetical protein